ncbi:MAG: hypothetical protein LBV47_08960 [Bacteroidales bacterium]|jgi:predicted metal-dependent hydrolase|nr:hypothetical protein [Bacteroidales bacterium]
MKIEIVKADKKTNTLTITTNDKVLVITYLLKLDSESFKAVVNEKRKSFQNALLRWLYQSNYVHKYGDEFNNN